MLDSKLPHYFSEGSVPTDANECLEAVQSNVTGPVNRGLGSTGAHSVEVSVELVVTS